MADIKKPTIKDVAKEANVSISVVSYVLNQSTEKTISTATKERVRQAAKRLHYVPNRIASGMRSRKSMSIGIVSYWDMDGSFFINMLNGIISALADKNYNVVICNTKSKKDSFSYLDYYQNKTIDGIIFISPYEALGRIDEAAHIKKMKQADVPFIIINGHSQIQDVNYINIDFYQSTYLATQYLIENGHEEITYVAPLHAGYVELQQRYLGYHDAMLQHHLKERLCDRDDIDKQIKGFKAVLTDKSDTAHAVMVEAFKNDLIIPRDFVIIAGNTESYSEYLIPPLSTVKIQAKEMGQLAANTILNQLKGKHEVINVKSECCLQIRKSC